MDHRDPGETNTPTGTRGLWQCPSRAEFPVGALEQALVVAGLFVPTVVTAVYFVGLAGTAAFWQQVAYAVGKGTQFALPVLWRSTMPRAKDDEPRATSGTDLAIGAASGLAISAGMLTLYFLFFKAWFEASGVSETVRQKMSGIGVASPVALVALGLFYSIIHSGLEEYYWRWFVFQGLKRILGLGRRAVTLAVAISCLAFAAHHVLIVGQFFGMAHPLTWILSAAVACGGIIWAIQYHASGRLAGCWLSHGIVDAGIFVVAFDMVYGVTK